MFKTCALPILWVKRSVSNTKKESFCFQNFVAFSKTLLLTITSVFFTIQVQAEGSRDLYPATGAKGYRSYLIGGNANASGFNPFPTKGTLKVYVKAGERLYVGSSVQAMTALNNGSTGTIHLRAPNGATYTSGTTSTKGRIENRTQELNGPNRSGVTNGYEPYYVDVKAGEEGVWEIDFIAFGSNTNLASPSVSAHPSVTRNGITYDGTKYDANFLASQNWVQPLAYNNTTAGNVALIAAFDVSVGAASNHSQLIPGRLYTNVLAMVGPNSRFSEESFYAKFHVVTPSGYTFLVNTNGKNGAAFNFFSNDKGVLKTEGNTKVPSYKSLNSSSQSDLLQNVWDPRNPDEGTHYTNKIFFNKPSSDLPTNANIRYNGETSTRTTWLRNVPIEPKISNFSMTCGGLLRFDSNIEGRYQILVDVGNNGSFEDPQDLILRGEGKIGQNTVLWDMKNGLGNHVGNNVSVRLAVHITTAEVHFPFIDVESNSNGIIIQLTDFYNNYAPLPDKDIIYWDDRNITGTNQTPQYAVIEGKSSSQGEHKWHGEGNLEGTFFGNNKTLDTWTYVNTNVEGTITTCTGIAGNVFHDIDNNANVNSSGAEQIPANLYATLVDNGGNLLQSVPVDKNGIFQFVSVMTGNYKVVLSKDSLSDTASLPAGWISTGEDCCDNAGNDGNINGITNVNVPSERPVTNVNFGIKTAPVILAKDNDFGSRNSLVEYTTPSSILANDSLNGVLVNPSLITLKVDGTKVSAPVSLKDSTGADVPGVMLNPDGTVTVAAGTPVGVYTLPYSICENTNPTNCDEALITIEVVEAPEIIAQDNDFGSRTSLVEYTTPSSILENDSFNGAPVDPSLITLKVDGTEVSAPVSLKDSTGADVPGVMLNPDGTVTVAAGTPVGVYTLPYSICENTNPTNCDEAMITIEVVEAPEIIAQDNDFGSRTSLVEYTTPSSILENDSLNGVPVDPSLITLKVDGTELTAPVSLKDSTGADVPGVMLNPDGTVTVAAGTPVGIYTLPYSICENANPTNCDEALITIEVVEAPEIIAQDNDFGSRTSLVEYITPSSILENDSLNGAPVDPSLITLKVDGTEVSAPVSLKDSTGADVPGVVLNPAGTVTVAAGTPVGKYTLPYSICENENPTNCDEALITIEVVEAPEILAVDNDFGSRTSLVEYTTPSNVLENDSLNGAPVDPSLIKLKVDGTELTAPASLKDSTGADVPGVVLNPDGTVTVAAGTPVGVYTLPYSICENANPTNCDEALITIEVVEAPEILAQDNDFGSRTSLVEYTTPSSILENDSFNGAPVDPSLITLKVDGTEVSAPVSLKDSTGADVPGVMLNPDGTVTVAAGTPVGVYTLPYSICENTNPTNCDEAMITIEVVEAPEIIAQDNDFGSRTSLVEYTTASSILENDSLNGVPVDPSLITLKVDGTEVSAPVSLKDSTGADVPGVVLNPAGTVTVAAGTPVGVYTLPYSICENENPTNCDEALITIEVVEAPEILAVDNDFGSRTSLVEYTTPSNVLENDSLNGAPVDPSLIKLKVDGTELTAPASLKDSTGADVPGVVLNPDGTVTVATGTPVGVYTLPYSICEIENPTNCDEALITIEVVAAPEILAVDNDFGSRTSLVEYTTPSSILENDSLNGVPVDPSLITLKVDGTELTAPVSLKDSTGTDVTGVVLNPDGTVTVATGTPVGVYTLPYSICEIENPTNCDEALITIEVEGIFDLSLSKQVKAGQKAVFNLNDTVTYVIKVINEGTIDATDIQLVDYIPVGLELVADSNWIELDQKANLATPIALLKAGEELSLEINFKVVSLANVQINNAAEISSAVGGIDRDSTPDENPSNDLAGEDDISTAVIALCPNDGKCLGVKILRKK